MTSRRTTLCLAMGSALALALTACGDTSEGGGGSSSDDPIKIMVLGSFSQPPMVVPQVATGAQAAVDRVNADGGIDGRDVELLSCDDEGNPNGAAACARQAVEEDVAAVVGALTFFGDSVVPLLERAEIPYILPLAVSAKEGQSPISFPVFSSATAAVGSLAGAAGAGCQQVAQMTGDVAAARLANEEFVEPAARALGVTMTPYFVPATSTDIGPFVSQALGAGADCFSYGVGPQLTSAALVALNQAGADVTNTSNALAMPEVLLGQIPEESEGFLAVSNFYYPSTGEEVAVQAEEDIHDMDSGASVDDSSLNSYAAVLVFAQAAEQADEITGPGVLNALNSMDSFDVGLFPAVDLADAGFIEAFPRVAASVLPVYRAEGGHYVPSGQPNVELLPIFTN